MGQESIGRHFSPSEAEIEAIRARVLAEGGDPGDAEARFRAKFEGANAVEEVDMQEGAIASLEKEIEDAWKKMTPEEKERFRKRHFEEGE